MNFPNKFNLQCISSGSEIRIIIHNNKNNFTTINNKKVQMIYSIPKYQSNPNWKLKKKLSILNPQKIKIKNI